MREELFCVSVKVLLNHSAVQAHGEELIGSMHGAQRRSVLGEWRIACERLYRYMFQALSVAGYGNGVSSVLTDPRCNQHRTSSGCMERAVRLPAAMKAVKEVSAEAGDKIQLISGLDEKYLEIAEERVIGKAHSKTYLKRMKGRCLAVTNPDSVVPLTEDSDGNGGEDTSTYCRMSCSVLLPFCRSFSLALVLKFCRRFERDLDGGTRRSWRCNQSGRHDNEWRMRQRVLCHEATWSSRWT